MIRLDQPDLKTIEHIAQQNPHTISFAQGALRIGGVDACIKEAVRAVALTDRADYYSHSLGIAPLRQAIATYLATLHAVSLPAEQIAITHGSIGGIAALCLLLLDHGDEVLLPEPTYPAYFNSIALAKAVARTVPAYELVATTDSYAWRIDLDLIVRSITPRTKMLVIAQPSNPAGVCLTREQLATLVTVCSEREIYLVVDEAYDNYFFDAPVVSATAYAVTNPFVIRVGTFSKTFGMSGWRVGFIVAAAELLQHLAAVHDGMIACPSVIGQYAAIAALDHQEVAARYTGYVRQSRDMALTLLAPIVAAGHIQMASPAAGFFLFIKTKHEDTTALTQDILTKAAVALVPGRNFGPTGRPFMRLCFARLQEAVQQGCLRLVQYYERYQ